MQFRTLQKSDMSQILKWRSQCPEALRTTFQLTEELQNDFYNNVISNRNSNARWWGIYDQTGEILIGYCAIENIDFVNSSGEISLLIDPQYRGKGYAKEALAILLDKGFNYLNLHKIKGECYFSNSAIDFWKKEVKKYKGKETVLPDEKYWNGKYYDTYRFDFIREDWNNVKT